MSEEDKIKEFESEPFKIKVFGSHREFLKTVGELLSNDTSLDIINELIENQMYINEIAVKLRMKSNKVIHHLKKLRELGLLTITSKPITKKGNEHKYFKMTNKIFILLDMTIIEIEEQGILKKIFKDGIKFASIGVAFCVALFVNIKNTNVTNYPAAFGKPETTENHLDFLVIPLIVVIIGLIIERILARKKRKK